MLLCFSTLVGFLSSTIQQSKLFHRTLLGNPDPLWPFPLFLYPPYSSELLRHTWLLRSPLHHRRTPPNWQIVSILITRSIPSTILSTITAFMFSFILLTANFTKLIGLQSAYLPSTTIILNFIDFRRGGSLNCSTASVNQGSWFPTVHPNFDYW